MTDNKLNNAELDILVIRTQHMSSAELQDALKRNVFSIKEVPYIKEYIPHKIEEERNKPIKMYHRRKAPDGKVFKAYEVPYLEKKGWVDSLEKIKQTIRKKLYIASKPFVGRHWKFLLLTIGATLAFIITSAITLFMYFDSKDKLPKEPSQIESKENTLKKTVNKNNINSIHK